MIHFAWPLLLLLLPLPWLVRLWWPPATESGSAALFAPFALALAGVGHRLKSANNLSWRHWLAALAWLFLLIAAARPQWLGDPITLPQAGRNLMLAIDVSGSMETPDMTLDGNQTSRLNAVKQVAGDFIEHRGNDRVGLILFGTQAYLQAPLTFDHTTVRHFLDEAVIGVAGRETAIGDAIGLVIKRLRKAPGGKGVLILLTDGQNTSGNVSPIQAAKLAAQTGLRIYTIGIGADRMRVQGLLGSRLINPSTNLDEATLKTIAHTTGGRYFRARSLTDLKSVYAKLDELEPVKGNGHIIRPVTALYPWPLGIALLLSMLLATASAIITRNKLEAME